MARQSKDEDNGAEEDEADIDGLIIEIDDLEDSGEEDSKSDHPDEPE